MAAALLASCGVLQQAQDDTQPPIGATGAMPQSRAIAQHATRSGSWMLPEAKSSDLVYVADTSAKAVFVYSYPHGDLVGTLRGFSHLGGAECVDSDGNVFVANANSVEEFAHGGSTPIASLRLPPKYGDVQSCGVDRASERIAIIFGFTDSSLAIFHGVTDKHPTIYGTLEYLAFCGYDDKSTLFIDGWKTTNHSALWELQKGSASLVKLKLDPWKFSVGSIQWDGTHIAFIDESKAVIHRIEVAGSSAKIIGSTRFRSVHIESRFWIEGTNVLLPIFKQGRSYVTLRPYPEGGRGTIFVSGLLHPVGVVISR